MVDANQRWDVPQAIEWMKSLAEFKPLWIEEPTSPDDILGHAEISKVKKVCLFVWLNEYKPTSILNTLKYLILELC